MLDVPLDSWYAWLGLSLAGVALVGAASGLPTAPPPNATAAAETVDRVAATEYASTAEHPLDATAVKLETRRLALRNDAGTAHATFAFAPVTPVPTGDSPLRDVIHGAHPSAVFDSPAAFQQAVIDSRTRASNATWREVDRTLLVRKTTWEGVDVVLVDA
ncbi:hypothetical protein GL213_12215 [Halogeometricum borinquense]|uniref:Uncharacterized protein n=1 Tax=Halogeometricum borinquense TaxID=60847 RepID=A0A6C0UDE5_9EURY|nr:hypothetical protein [Halogeometricum borinquense]QIB73376.1 hypothetical protein G3I44_03205 [Halogeometricum borinquense]QIQ77225.1 hypothetical protein GL213_12215 [Halogeometricum borinquense]